MRALCKRRHLRGLILLERLAFALLPFFFGFGSADVSGLQGQRVCEFTRLGQFPAEDIHVFRLSAPVLLGQSAYAVGLKPVLVIQEGVTEQPYRHILTGKALQKL